MLSKKSIRKPKFSYIGCVVNSLHELFYPRSRKSLVKYESLKLVDTSQLNLVDFTVLSSFLRKAISICLTVVIMVSFATTYLVYKMVFTSQSVLLSYDDDCNYRVLVESDLSKGNSFACTKYNQYSKTESRVAGVSTKETPQDVFSSSSQSSQAGMKRADMNSALTYSDSERLKYRKQIAEQSAYQYQNQNQNHTSFSGNMPGDLDDSDKPIPIEEPKHYATFAESSTNSYSYTENSVLGKSTYSSVSENLSPNCSFKVGDEFFADGSVYEMSEKKVPIYICASLSGDVSEGKGEWMYESTQMNAGNVYDEFENCIALSSVSAGESLNLNVVTENGEVVASCELSFVSK